jgi:hypothetical protein
MHAYSLQLDWRPEWVLARLITELPGPEYVFDGVSFEQWPNKKILHLFANAGWYECIQRLVAHGVDINITDPNTGCTPLHHCSFIYSQIVLLRAAAPQVVNYVMVAAQAQEDQGEMDGHAAEHILAFVQQLMQQGNTADVDRIQNRIVQTMKILIDAGADKNMTNKWGETALQLAHGAGLTQELTGEQSNQHSQIELAQDVGLTPVLVVVAQAGLEHAGLKDTDFLLGAGVDTESDNVMAVDAAEERCLPSTVGII